MWALLIVSYVVLGSRVIWAYDGRNYNDPLIWFASNAYVWVSIALLLGLPVAKAPVPVAAIPTTVPPAAPGVAEPVPAGPVSELDDAMASLLDEERVSVGAERSTPAG
jgi:alpha-1,2-mannosyltransferase